MSRVVIVPTFVQRGSRCERQFGDKNHQCRCDSISTKEVVFEAAHRVNESGSRKYLCCSSLNVPCGTSTGAHATISRFAFLSFCEQQSDNYVATVASDTLVLQVHSASLF